MKTDMAKKAHPITSRIIVADMEDAEKMIYGLWEALSFVA